MGPETSDHLRRGALGRTRPCALAALAIGSLTLAAPAQAQRATANSIVAIETPGSIAKTFDMDFGKIAQNTTGGTVVMSAADPAQCTATAGLVRVGTCHSATFSVYGKRNWNVRLKDSNGGVVTLNGPNGATMQLTNLTFNAAGMANLPGATGWNLGRFNITTTTGFATFWLGGTLNVKPAQPAGVYRGTMNVQIQFN